MRGLARLALKGVALVGVLWTAGPAEAHPHVWIDADATVVLGPAGQITALDVTWTFDELYSEDTVIAVEGRTSADLRPLVTEAVHNLVPWLYFTDLRADGIRQTFGPVEAYDAHWRDGRLIYAFTLPLTRPVDPIAETVELRLYDPTYYIDIAVPEDRAVTLRPSDAACSVTRSPAPEQPNFMVLSDAYQSVVVEPGEDGIGYAYAEIWRVTCP
ncbi:DUF1007 family protein [Roseospira marina]|nr:DUF1007 family protein [Roseospira marina]MBB4315619.1 ABC-type uncharacterized transport system substrate-binding protein [Roseospira marina]MBB5088615.1 ABC-type uncharacterized transport system substrate-binding protein [Roseospira marina]